MKFNGNEKGDDNKKNRTRQKESIFKKKKNVK